jgi:hypothetical protein
MTFPELKQNIRTWVANTLNMEVIFAPALGPRPEGQYALLNIVSVEKLINDVRVETRLGNGKIQADYQGIRKVMTSVNIYRDNPMEEMVKLRSSLSKILTQDYFNDLDIGLINSDNVNHIPELIGKDWEDRSQCDFFFHYVPTIEADDDISEIKKIEVTNQINGEVINVQ